MASCPWGFGWKMLPNVSGRPIPNDRSIPPPSPGHEGGDGARRSSLYRAAAPRIGRFVEQGVVEAGVAVGGGERLVHRYVLGDGFLSRVLARILARGGTALEPARVAAELRGARVGLDEEQLRAAGCRDTRPFQAGRAELAVDLGGPPAPVGEGDVKRLDWCRGRTPGRRLGWPH